VQGYVSWEGRSDYLRSMAIAQVVRACGDFAHASGGLQSLEDRSQGLPFTAALSEVVYALSPLSQDAVTEIDQEIAKFTDAFLQGASIPPHAPETNKLISRVESICTKVIRSSVRMPVYNSP
jgi:hypothetical protein